MSDADNLDAAIATTERHLDSADEQSVKAARQLLAWLRELRDRRAMLTVRPPHSDEPSPHDIALTLACDLRDLRVNACVIAVAYADPSVESEITRMARDEDWTHCTKLVKPLRDVVSELEKSATERSPALAGTDTERDVELKLVAEGMAAEAADQIRPPRVPMQQPEGGCLAPVDPAQGDTCSDDQRKLLKIDYEYESRQFLYVYCAVELWNIYGRCDARVYGTPRPQLCMVDDDEPYRCLAEHHDAHRDAWKRCLLPRDGHLTHRDGTYAWHDTAAILRDNEPEDPR